MFTLNIFRCLVSAYVCVTEIAWISISMSAFFSPIGVFVCLRAEEILKNSVLFCGFFLVHCVNLIDHVFELFFIVNIGEQIYACVCVYV